MGNRPTPITKEEKMNNNYETELEELRTVYENTVNEANNRYEIKLQVLVSFMKDFIGLYENKKIYEKKLEVLDAKLNDESCSCNWDEDGNELGDEEDDE